MRELKIYSLFIFLLSSFFSGLSYADEDIYIALRANKGSEKALEKWQATADYLSKNIRDYRFILVPFENNSALNQAVSLGRFHFCITNPASGIEHKIRNGAEPLATLVNRRQGKGYSKFGSVIFTRSDRTDVNSLHDLKGKMFTAVDELGFGGWRIAWLEFLNNGINPYRDFSELHFVGGKQQNVVYEVRDKKAAAGSVRTDTLERMAASGEISLADYKILAQKKSSEFPFLHSTKLYPEWMFSLVGSVKEDLKTKVIKTLFSISRDSFAAKKGKYVGWISPLDYTSVGNLLKELKVGPYNVATMSPVQRLISQYGVLVLITLIIIAVLTFIVIYVVGLNKKILEAKDSLKKEAEISKKLEIQLLHSKRIESLGKLTGGIAHDFNNMLASILGYTELALETEKVKNDETLKRYLNQVVDASTRSSELVSQMLTFSRTEGDKEKTEDISVAIIMDNIKHLLEPLAKNDIRIKKVDADLLVNANPILITQALMNLYLNAKDSMQDTNPKITIEAKAIDITEENQVCNSCLKAILGEYVEISITDNGGGIEPNNIAHIFEPFFTTKEVGKGTGMGLPMVHGIIHKHNGHILVDSVLGTGTTIKLLIPRLNELTGSTYKNDSNDILISENKYIVIIDDEVSLTTYLSEYLKLKGFKVRAFNDSQKALSYIETSLDKIALVITDQIMPNLNGLELSKKIIEQNKSMPIIICSGLSENLDKQAMSKFSNVEYMTKPIKSDVLVHKIVELLR